MRDLARRERLVTGVAITVLVAGALWQIATPNGDLYQYRCFALAFWRGSAGAVGAWGCAGRLPPAPFPAGRVLPLEYPPLALAPFSLPLALGGWTSVTLYVALFNLLMLACLVATGALVWHVAGDDDAGRRAVVLFWVWTALGATTIALVRYDPLPALIVVAALVLARRGPSLWAYVLLALGASLKLYPALFVPFLAAWDWRRRADAAAPLTRALWAAGPALALGVALALQGVANLATGTRGVPWLSVQGGRPPQIESTAAALDWALNIVGGHGGAIHAVSVQRSLALVAAPGRQIATVTLALALALIAALFVATLGGWLTPPRGMAAALVALMGGAAVFSPQYLIWATPLVALVAATEARHRRALVALWTLVATSTTVIYSIGYLFDWPGTHLTLFMLLVALRDALVWAAVVALALPALDGFQSRRRATLALAKDAA